jgi:SPX domain protein involved in polyphosphate accumulation
MIKEFYPYYIAYDELKKALKTDFVDEPTSDNTKPARKEWTEDDETNFVSLLESELEKVFLFQKRKSEEIVARIQESELEVNDVVSRLDNSTDSRRQSTRTARPAPTDADFLMLEQVLSDIIADVHDLAKFTQLNYTGFQKIIKKHDVCFPSNFRVGPQIANNRTERNSMVPQAGFCDTSEGQAFLQGQLRRFCD